MKRTAKLITMALLFILMLIPLSASASQVAVSKASFPVIINGRTLVPLRFISEAFKYEVNYVDLGYDTSFINIIK